MSSLFSHFPQMPSMAASDNDVECYENEMASFDFSNNMKKAKLSDSSLQRVTPDSGIALNYQSSVSSVGSLSPPIEKAAGEEMSKTFQSYEGGQVAVPDMQDLHKQSPLPPSADAAMSNYSSANSPSSSPNTPNVAGGGSIPLSHAPGNMTQLNNSSSLMYGASQIGGTIHSVSPMNALNTAFPFNGVAGHSHHYSMHQPFHSYTVSPAHHPPPPPPPPPPMFSPPGTNTYSRSPYANNVFSQFTPSQHHTINGTMSSGSSPYRTNFPHSPSTQHYTQYNTTPFSKPATPLVSNMPPPALVPNGSPAQLPSSPNNLSTSAMTPTEQQQLKVEEEENSLPPLIKLEAEQQQQEEETNYVPEPSEYMETTIVKEELQENNEEEEQEPQLYTKR